MYIVSSKNAWHSINSLLFNSIPYHVKFLVYYITLLHIAWHGMMTMTIINHPSLVLSLVCYAYKVTNFCNLWTLFSLVDTTKFLFRGWFSYNVSTEGVLPSRAHVDCYEMLTCWLRAIIIILPCKTLHCSRLAIYGNWKTTILHEISLNEKRILIKRVSHTLIF